MYGATRTIAPAGGDYSVAATWVEGVAPTSSDDVVATASSGNLRIAAAAAANTVDLTGYTGQLRMLSFTWTISGNTFKLAPGMSTLLNSLSAITFSGATGAVNITTAGNSLRGVTFNSHTATFHTLDSFTATGTVTFTDGSLATDSQAWAVGTFSSPGGDPDPTPTRTFTAGSSTISISKDWNTYYATNLALNMGTSTLHFLAASGVRLLGVPVGSTFYNVEWDAFTPSTGNYVYMDCCSLTATETFHQVTFHAPLAVVFSGNDVWTFGSIVWDTASASRLAIMSDDQDAFPVCGGGGGGHEAVVLSMVNNTSADYLDLCATSAIGGAHWFAGANSAQTLGAGTNPGWTFTVPPSWIAP